MSELHRQSAALSKQKARLWLLDGAVELIRKIRGREIDKLEQAGGRHVRAERDPVDQIGGRLEDIGLAGQALQLNLELAVGVERPRPELHGRTDREGGRGSDAVVEPGLDRLGLQRRGV